MICLVSPNGHGDCIFEFATNSRKNVLETYESKPSTEIRIEKNNSVIDLTFYEDGSRLINGLLLICSSRTLTLVCSDFLSLGYGWRECNI